MSRRADSYVWFCDHYDEEKRELTCTKQEWESCNEDGVPNRPEGWSFSFDDGDDTESYCPDHCGENESTEYVISASAGREMEEE